MGIIERIKDLLKANINDLIDKAEDPEKMLKQIIIDMEESLDQAVQGLAQTMASEKQMARQQETAEAQSADWEAKAKLALANGNQDLARQALANKLKSDGNAKQYAGMHATLESQVETMRSQVEELKAKIDEARSKQAVLVARAQMADTQKKFATSMGGTGTKSAFAKMDKMEQKIERKEAEAQAYTEIAGTPAAGDPFKKMEEDSAVDAEMQRLMGEMNKKG
jgi:phage shock protein A